MTPTAEQAIDLIRMLPPPEREKVREWIEVECHENIRNGNDREGADKQAEKFERALRWIDENREKYDGKFVVLEGDTLISSGSDPKPLYEQARAMGIKNPFVKKIRARILPFGGW
ncbi:MAG: hypothetical protein IT174_02250 [Acidobacteria bacterium]|nr:hypothetical protein [Acidobacteriota bacterium]